MGQAWLIASGKGGVGKSTLAAGLGQALSLLGKSVLIIDTDIGLRDQDVILGLENRIVYDLVDVCREHCTADQAIIPVEDFDRLFLLPAAQFARVRDLEAASLRKLMKALKADYDFLLIDCPAGIEKGLRTLIRSQCDEAVIVATPDDVCIRNAERTAGLLMQKGHLRPRVIVNKLVPGLITLGEMPSAATVSQVLELELLGEIPEDGIVLRSLLTRKPLLRCECDASEAMTRIARRMTGEEVPFPDYGAKKPGFFRRLQSLLRREKTI